MKKGASIVFTIGILLILFVFTTTLLILFAFWEKTASKIISGKGASRFAKNGIEEAIWEIDHDSREYDSYQDTWRKNFSGEDIDVDNNGIPDSKWICIRDKNNKIIGRYGVLVEDESGKININGCGNSHGGFNEGFSVCEINLLKNLVGESTERNTVTFRYGPDGLPGKAKIDDDNDSFPIENDGIDNDGDGIIDEVGEGIDEQDEFNFKKPEGDDRPYFIPADIKLVEGIGKKTYRKVENSITVSSYDFNRNKSGEYRMNLNNAFFDDLYNLFLKLGYGKNQSAQIAVNIIDFRDTDNVPTIVEKLNGKKIIGVDQTPYLNEVEAVRPWKVQVLPSGTVIFSEQGGQFLEIFNPYSVPLDIGGWRITGVVTLFSNLWSRVINNSQEIYDDVAGGETEIDRDKAKSIIQSLVPTSIIIPPGKKIQPYSYYTVGDCIRIVIIIPPEGPPIPLLLPIADPSGCQQYEPILAINPGSFGSLSGILGKVPFLSTIGLDFTVSMFDRNENLIEKADYPIDFPATSVQKNDPRMRGIADWYPAVPTPGKTNYVFQPWVGGEFGKAGWVYLWPSSFNIKNRSFSSVGELSFIHRMQHWRSLDFWKDGIDRKTIDYFTVVKNPDIPVYGRLNVNTVSETALMCLPLVDSELAKAIVEAVPYMDISEILGIYGAGSSNAERLNREITKYGFDLKDNDMDLVIDTEREKERIFSKIVNLITVRSNVFKIVSVGQKVDDKNNNGKIEEKEITAEKKVTVFYDRIKKKIVYREQ